MDCLLIKIARKIDTNSALKLFRIDFSPKKTFFRNFKHNLTGNVNFIDFELCSIVYFRFGPISVSLFFFSSLRIKLNSSSMYLIVVGNFSNSEISIPCFSLHLIVIYFEIPIKMSDFGISLSPFHDFFSFRSVKNGISKHGDRPISLVLFHT